MTYSDKNITRQLQTVALKDILQNSPHKETEIFINRQKETGRSSVL